MKEVGAVLWLSVPCGWPPPYRDAPSPSLQQPGAALTWPLLLSLDWQDALAQLAVEPELHPDEGFAAFLGQLAPWLWPGQHVTDTALRQAQHLEWQTKTLALVPRVECEAAKCFSDIHTECRKCDVDRGYTRSASGAEQRTTAW